MSYSLFANNKPVLEQSLSVAAPAGDYDREVCLPALDRLIRLRDALLLLKVPLANSGGLRTPIEQRLLSNDVYERVLGKLTADMPDTAATLPQVQASKTAQPLIQIKCSQASLL